MTNPGISRRFFAVCLALLVLSGACAEARVSSADAEAWIAAGERLYRAEGCVNCHGGQGQGVIGPQINQGAVIETFPSCEDQRRWVTLGSAGWIRDVSSTYGAVAKPVRGGMPGFGRRLSAEQISQVVSYTRTTFGGEKASDVVSDCGT